MAAFNPTPQKDDNQNSQLTFSLLVVEWIDEEQLSIAHSDKTLLWVIFQVVAQSVSMMTRQEGFPQHGMRHTQNNRIHTHTTAIGEHKTCLDCRYCSPTLSSIVWTLEDVERGGGAIKKTNRVIYYSWAENIIPSDITAI